MSAIRPTASPKLLTNGRQCLSYPAHLDRWRSRLATARYRQATIVAFGDSIAKGQYSSDVGTIDDTNEAIWRVRGWVPQVRSLFADRYGAVGEGLIYLGDNRCAFSGVQNIASIGIGQTGRRLDAGDTITVALPACTDIKIYWWWESSATDAPFTYTIDGGSPVTATPGGFSDAYPVEVATGLANTTHTLVITGPASKRANLSAVGAFVNRASGVAVHRMGIAGGYLDTLFFTGTGSSATRVNKLSVVQPGADLAMFACGANDASATGQGLGKTPATFASLLTDVTTFATANGTDCLIVAGPRRPSSAFAGQTYTDDDFYTAAKGVAAANSHVAYFDLKTVWGTFETADANGLYEDAFIHPSLRGHSDFARLVYEAIGGV